MLDHGEIRDEAVLAVELGGRGDGEGAQAFEATLARDGDDLVEHAAAQALAALGLIHDLHDADLEMFFLGLLFVLVFGRRGRGGLADRGVERAEGQELTGVLGVEQRQGAGWVKVSHVVVEVRMLAQVGREVGVDLLVGGARLGEAWGQLGVVLLGFL